MLNRSLCRRMLPVVSKGSQQNNMANVGLLEDNALKRKKRLKALQRKHVRQSDETVKLRNDLDEDEKLPRPVFRSYRPQSSRLLEVAMETIKPSNVTEEIQEQIEAGRTKHVIEEVDLMNLAPRKPDWDLKRDITKKLDKLERRTQRAITELIRERLKASQGNLAAVVAVREAVSHTEEDE